MKNTETSSNYNNKSIILFDGVCNLCNGFVQFIIKRDQQSYFLFGSLQSNAATQLLQQFNSLGDKLSSVVLIENNMVYTQSTAALKVLKQLPRWKMFYAFIILPKFIRDGIYDLTAKYRYKIFGKRETCMVPTPELQSRFIE
ncbi:MAG: DCC1-like thiol-disulfide oxidoreductase family protein [Bacteroidia bacterium]